MKFSFTERKTVEVKWMQVNALVRYWEDAKLNGVDVDEDGKGFPLKNGEMWKPIIDVDNGIIKDWPQSTTADIHFKVCDCCTIQLADEGSNILFACDGYVPKILSPGGQGYGDYIIMKVDGEGRIEGWDKEQLQKLAPEED